MSTTMPVEVRPFAHTEFRCKGCGATYRVDFELSAGSIVGRGSHYQHCPGDQNRQLEGPIVAIWEKRNEHWTLVANRATLPH